MFWRHHETEYGQSELHTFLYGFFVLLTRLGSQWYGPFDCCKAFCETEDYKFLLFGFIGELQQVCFGCFDSIGGLLLIITSSCLSCLNPWHGRFECDLDVKCRVFRFSFDSIYSSLSLQIRLLLGTMHVMKIQRKVQRIRYSDMEMKRIHPLSFSYPYFWFYIL